MKLIKALEEKLPSGKSKDSNKDLERAERERSPRVDTSVVVSPWTKVRTVRAQGSLSFWNVNPPSPDPCVGRVFWCCFVLFVF